MLSSESQAVIVQNVQLLSANSAPVWKPGAFFTCRTARSVWIAKNGTKRIERTRKRVRLTKIIAILEALGYDAGLTAELSIPIHFVQGPVEITRLLNERIL